MTAPTEEYIAANIGLRLKVLRLEQELLELKVSAVYRHLQTLECAVPSGCVIRGPDE